MLRAMRMVLALAVVCAVAGAEEHVVLPLWEKGAPGAKGDTEKDVPTLTVWLAPEGDGMGMVVAPGGGYGGLAVDHEGVQIAQWLNSHGISAFILRYRHAPGYGHPYPLMDAARALRTVRAKAGEWKLNPGRIGMMGFSAGGHLTATLATQWDEGDANAADPIDRVSSRPDFVAPTYPVITMTDPYTHAGSRKNLLGENPTEEMINKMSAEKNVNEKTPPTFIFITQDDQAVPVQNALLFYGALCEHKVLAELHVYQHGKHGVGLAKDDPVLSTWGQHFIDWVERLPLAK